MKKDLFDIGLLIFRIGFGFLMLSHGIPKLNLLSDPTAFPDPLGIGSMLTVILAIFAEVICPVLIILGIRVKWASIPIILTMLVAIFIVHNGDNFADKEKAILYLVAFTSILFIGSGKYSLDKNLESVLKKK